MKKSVIALLATGITAAGYLGAQVYVNSLLDTKIQAQFAIVSDDSGMQFDYDDASANLFNGNILVQGLRAVDPEGHQAFLIDEVRLIGYEEDKISDFTEVQINGFSLSEQLQSADLRAPKALLEASYDFSTSLQYDEDVGTSKLKAKLSALSIATLNFDLELENSQALMAASLDLQKRQQNGVLTTEQQLQSQTQMMAAMQELTPKALAFSLNSDGALAKLIDEQLSMNGLSQSDVEQMLSFQLSQSPLPERLKKGVMDFVKGKESFSVSMTSSEESNIQTLSQQLMSLFGQPEEQAKLLNLSVQGK